MKGFKLVPFSQDIVVVVVRRSLLFGERMQLQSCIIESLVLGNGVAKTISHLIRS